MSASQVLSRKDATTLLDCAQSCFDATECAFFNWDSHIQKCDLAAEIDGDQESIGHWGGHTCGAKFTSSASYTQSKVPTLKNNGVIKAANGCLKAALTDASINVERIRQMKGDLLKIK